MARTYQWRRITGGTPTPISGATASTYELVEADEGKDIDCAVSNGGVTAYAEPVGPIAPALSEPEPEWFALIDATNPASMYQNSDLTGQPVVNTNRVGAVLDTTENDNHWRHAYDTSARTEYLSADDGLIEIGDNYWRCMAIDGTTRLVDVRKPWWFAMAIRLGGPINDYVVLLDRDYDSNNELAAVIEAGNLLLERKVSGSTLTATASGASVITASVWGVISVGYDGSNITARVNKGTKATTADTRSLPDADGDAPLRQGPTPSAFHVKAVGFLDYYPDAEEETTAIEAIASMAGLTL